MSHFVATNVRSGRTYRTDSASFTAGYFTNADTPAPVGNWRFWVCECVGSHTFSRAAHEAITSAPQRSRWAARTPVGYLRQGDRVTDFRGRVGSFQYVSRASVPGKSAKVIVLADGFEQEHYSQVWHIEVIEWTAEKAARAGVSSAWRFYVPIGYPCTYIPRCAECSGVLEVSGRCDHCDPLFSVVGEVTVTFDRDAEAERELAIGESDARIAAALDAALAPSWGQPTVTPRGAANARQLRPGRRYSDRGERS